MGKRNVESMIHTLQAEIDDMLGQAKNSEEKTKRAMVDAARLVDELRAEQDHATAESRGKRALDTQINELENRIVDAEASAMKAGKAAMSKLEMRIRELEMELGTVQTQTQESYKSFQRAERRVKELQFLNTPLSPLEGLVTLLGLGLDSAKLHLQLTNPHLQLAHGSLSSLHSRSLGINNAVLQFIDLGIKGTLSTALSSGMVLFCAELISQACSINHSPLGLLLRVLCLSKHVINLSLEGVDHALNIALVMHSFGVNDLHLIDGIPSISQVNINLPLSAVSRVQESPGLLNLTEEGIGLSLSNANSLSDLLARAGLIFVTLDGVPEGSLVPLDGLLSLNVGLVGMVKSDLQLIDVRL